MIPKVDYHDSFCWKVASHMPIIGFVTDIENTRHIKKLLKISKDQATGTVLKERAIELVQKRGHFNKMAKIAYFTSLASFAILTTPLAMPTILAVSGLGGLAFGACTKMDQCDKDIALTESLQKSTGPVFLKRIL